MQDHQPLELLGDPCAQLFVQILSGRTGSVSIDDLLRQHEPSHMSQIHSNVNGQADGRVAETEQSLALIHELVDLLLSHLFLHL